MIHTAPNSRKYIIVRPSSLDYYVWVIFFDNPATECLIMHYDR